MAAAVGPGYISHQQNFDGLKHHDSVSVEMDPRMFPFLAVFIYNETTGTYTLAFPNCNHNCTTPEVVHGIQNRCLGNPLELVDVQTDRERHADSNEQDMVLTVVNQNQVSEAV